MKKFIQQNWFKLSIFIAVLIMILGSFLWYGYRPYKIKKDCAWIKMSSNAVAYRSAIGNEDAQKKCVNDCLLTFNENEKSIFGLKLYKNVECPKRCSSLYSPERDAAPKRSWRIEASEVEYKDCLRKNGF